MFNKLKKLEKRNKRVLVNMFLAVALRGSGMLISLLMLPMYMSFFSNQSTLGIWFTLLAFINWFITFDLGVTNGLRNRLVGPILNSDGEEIKRLISSSYGVIFLLLLLISIIAIPVFTFINWQTFLNTNISNAYLLKVIVILFLGVMIQFVLKTVYSVLYALNSPSLVSLIALFSSILLLIGLKILPKYSEEVNLLNLSLLYLITSTLPIIFVTIYVKIYILKSNFFSIKSIHYKYGKKVLSIGIIFFLIQILYLIMSNTNEVFITTTNSSKDVVTYKVYYSLFSLVSSFFVVMMTPLWSEITTAYEKEEYNWLSGLAKRLYKLLFLSIIMLILLTFSSQAILDIWLKEKSFQINYLYCFVFSIFVFVSMWNSIISSFANGLGILKIQLIFMTVGVLLFMVFIYITKDYNNWIFIIVANILAMLPYCIVQSIWLRNFLKEKRY
ncbi:hypothetical protein [Empedobacter sp. UBA7620]|uniref:hypothetical protein n=1 Tax=Empedobacter sp. UBA7620 TaxID=1946452 RepID=UPI0025C13D1A|nr:hypothetical protein [Empedobacter sp. UBA7620]